ncbi:MAG: hypothetical protein AD742_06270 [Methylibium sp. NZG]|nr:MAG: hypothetical protein AD742_06270 [Methylibium sp. NZG]
METSSTPPEPATAQLPRRRRGWLIALVGLAAVVLLLASGLSSLWWAAFSEPGSAWLLSKVPGLVIVKPKGALGGDFEAERVELELPGGDKLILTVVGWRGLGASRFGSASPYLRVAIDALYARRVDYVAAPQPKTDAPLQPPATLRVPFELQIKSLKVGEVHAAALGAQPLRDLSAALHLGADGGALHRVDGLSLSWGRFHAAGSARVGTDGAMPLDANLGLAQQAGDALVAWSAPIRVAGPLAAPVLQATLRTEPAEVTPAAASPRPSPSPSRTPASASARPLPPSAVASLAAQRVQSLDLRATLKPFERWPLGDLRARTEALDLSAFHPAAPATALSGDAVVVSRALDQPITVELSLANAQAGRWNEGRLPVRSVAVELQGRADDPNTLDLRRLDAELGTLQQTAGTLQGQGRWTPDRWNVDATLKAVQPSLLDARAAAMQLSGPVAAIGSGFAAAAANASNAVTVELKADLAGQLSGAVLGTQVQREQVRTAQLKLGALWSPLRIELRELQAQTGGARASASGTLTRPQRDAPWRAVAKASLVEFDPTPWWPGREDSPWRKGPHRLNAQAEVDLVVPPVGAVASAARPSNTTSTGPSGAPSATPTGSAPSPSTRPFAAALAGLRGRVSLAFGNSLLAGVPLSGEVKASAADGRVSVPLLSLDLAGNRLSAEGSLSTAIAPAPVSAPAPAPSPAPAPTPATSASAAKSPASGAADRWDVTLAAPALARLAPLWQLLQAPGADGRLAGAVNASARVTGRWPELAGQGELDATALRAGAVSLQAGRARWQLGSTLDAAADAQVSLTQLAWGDSPAASGAAVPMAAVESAQLLLKGTGRAHSLELRAESRALPPEWAQALQTAQALNAPSAVGATTAAPPGRPGAASADGAASGADAASGAGNVTAAGSGAGAGAARDQAPAPAAGTGASPASGDIAARSRGRTVALLQAQGGLQAVQGNTPSGWRGSLNRLEWLDGAAGAAPWLRTRDVALELQWAGGPTRASAQPGRVELLGGALRWSRLNWQGALAGAPAQIDVQADIEPLRVAPLLARAQPSFGWGGDLQLAGSIDLRSAPNFSADVVIERRSGDLTVTDEIGTQALGLSDLRLGLDAKDGVWSFTQGLAGKTLGVGAGAVVVRTSPQVLWPAADAPIQGVLELQVANLGTWGTWVPAGWRLGGELRTSASIGGRFGAPEYTGEVRGKGLSLRNFLEGVNVSDGDVLIALQATSARIERFKLRAGSGSLDVQGTAGLGEAPQANLQLVAERFLLLGRVDRRVVTSGQGQLRIDRESLGFDGRFGIDEALIDFTRSDAPSLGSDVQVRRARPSDDPRLPARAAAGASASSSPGSIGSPGAGANAAPRAATNGPTTANRPAAAAPTRKVALDLRVALGDKLRLRGRGLDTLLKGDLHLTSPGGRLAVNGTVNAAEGTYEAYGQKLGIDRGNIVFNGPLDNPRLDIEAVRPDSDVRVGVAVTGTAVNPRIRLFSVPELSEIDKLSWLVLGRPSDGLGRADTALLQRAAIALLSGEGPGVTDQLVKAIGLDELSLKQSDGEVRETVVSLGKNLSRRWYVGYERGLNATAGTWQLIYRIAQRFTLRAQSGLDNSLDVIWTWRWQ